MSEKSRNIATAFTVASLAVIGAAGYYLRSTGHQAGKKFEEDVVACNAKLKETRDKMATFGYKLSDDNIDLNRETLPDLDCEKLTDVQSKVRKVLDACEPVSAAEYKELVISNNLDVPGTIKAFRAPIMSYGLLNEINKEKVAEGCLCVEED